MAAVTMHHFSGLAAPFVRSKGTVLGGVFKCYERYKQDHDDGGVYADAIRAKIRDADTKIANIMRAIEAGILTETTGERLKALEAEKGRLNDALQAEEMRLSIQLT